MANRSFYSVLALCSVALSQPLSAAGFQLFERSASGLGRAYAGEAAALENTSVIFTNPSAAVAFDQIAFSIGGVYVAPNVDFSGSATTFGVSNDADADNIAGSGVVPNLSVVVPIAEDWAAAFSLGSSFTLGVEFEDDYSGSFFGDIAEIETADANLSLAYQVNDAWRLGAGLSYIWGEGRISSAVPVDSSMFAGATSVDMSGDNDALTWNLGATWQLTPEHRIAATYKHSVTLDLEGESESDLDADYDGPGSLEIDLPAMASLASYHQLNQQLALHLGVDWTGWSRFETLTAVINGESQLIKEENFNDTFRVSSGVTYQYNTELMLRAGLAYDQSAVDDEDRTLSIPDSDRFWYSFGAGYQLTPTIDLDFGLSYIYMPDADIDEQDSSGMFSVSGTATGDIWLAGLQYSQRF